MVWGETTETLKALEIYQESLEIYSKSEKMSLSQLINQLIYWMLQDGGGAILPQISMCLL